MQPYKYDIKKFLLISAVLGIFASSAFSTATSALGLSFGFSIGFATFVVGLFWGLFDQFFWKKEIFRTLGISELPDLNGIWVGEVDRLGENNPHRFELRVFQTYSRISIQTNSGNSKGNSVCAIFLTDETRKNFDIMNYWSSRTKSLDPNSVHQEEFKGLSLIDIRMHDGELVLEDYYFTDRNPPTKGKVILHRVADSTSGAANENVGPTLPSTKDTDSKGKEHLPGPQAIKAPPADVTQLDNAGLAARKLICEVARLKSNSGSVYLGCHVSEDSIRPFIDSLSIVLGEKFEKFEKNRFERDGSDYHITILTTPEYKKSIKKARDICDEAIGSVIEFGISGVGHASKGDDNVYFIVLSSHEGAELRTRLGLKKKDFHITLGFSESDVHGVPKNESSLI